MLATFTDLFKHIRAVFEKEQRPLRTYELVLLINQRGYQCTHIDVLEAVWLMIDRGEVDISRNLLFEYIGR